MSAMSRRDDDMAVRPAHERRELVAMLILPPVGMTTQTIAAVEKAAHDALLHRAKRARSTASQRRRGSSSSEVGYQTLIVALPAGKSECLYQTRS